MLYSTELPDHLKKNGCKGTFFLPYFQSKLNPANRPYFMRSGVSALYLPMRKLYQFFFLLLLILFIVSFLYGTLLSYGVYQTTYLVKTPAETHTKTAPFFFHIYTGLWQGLVFTAVLFFTIAMTFRMAFRQQKKFTLRDIIQYCGLFFGLTALVYILFTGWFYFSGYYIGLFLLSANFFILPAPLWWVLPLVWIALFIFLGEKIKNKPEYER